MEEKNPESVYPLDSVGFLFSHDSIETQSRNYSFINSSPLYCVTFNEAFAKAIISLTV